MSQTHASSRKLAAALAARLDRLVPDPVAVTVDDANVVIMVRQQEAGSSGAAAILDDDDGRDPLERAETAARAVLSGVQDCVIEELRERWPAPVREAELPLPGVRIIDGELHSWYGEEEGPSVRLDAISLRDLAD